MTHIKKWQIRCYFVLVGLTHIGESGYIPESWKPLKECPSLVYSEFPKVETVEWLEMLLRGFFFMWAELQFMRSAAGRLSFSPSSLDGLNLLSFPFLSQSLHGYRHVLQLPACSKDNTSQRVLQESSNEDTTLLANDACERNLSINWLTVSTFSWCCSLSVLISCLVLDLDGTRECKELRGSPGGRPSTKSEWWEGT